MVTELQRQRVDIECTHVHHLPAVYSPYERYLPLVSQKRIFHYLDETRPRLTTLSTLLNFPKKRNVANAHFIVLTSRCASPLSWMRKPWLGLKFQSTTSQYDHALSETQHLESAQPWNKRLAFLPKTWTEFPRYPSTLLSADCIWKSLHDCIDGVE